MCCWKCLGDWRDEFDERYVRDGNVMMKFAG